MGLFLWKKAQKPPVPAVLEHIIYNTETAHKYTTTESERVFFTALDAALRSARKSPFYSVTRMANGALSVSCCRAYLGKIKLQGHTTWMQYITSRDVEVEENKQLDEYVALLKHWVKAAE